MSNFRNNFIEFMKVRLSLHLINAVNDFRDFSRIVTPLLLFRGNQIKLFFEVQETGTQLVEWSGESRVTLPLSKVSVSFVCTASSNITNKIVYSKC